MEYRLENRICQLCEDYAHTARIPDRVYIGNIPGVGWGVYANFLC